MPFKDRDKRLEYLKRYREENKKLAEFARENLNAISGSIKGIDKYSDDDLGVPKEGEAGYNFGQKFKKFMNS